MISALIIVIGLSLLIVGHELAHFTVAKLFHIRVDEFGFGFPPRILAWRRKGDETEYSINWLPFGGFVKIAGENLENDKERGIPKNSITGKASDMGEVERGRLFYFRPVWQRFCVIAAGVVANFILGWFLLSLVLTVGVPSAVVITGVAAGSPAAQAGLSSGDVFRGFSTADSFITYVDAYRGVPVNFRILLPNGEKTIQIIPRVNPPQGQGALGVELTETGEPPMSLSTALGQGFRQSILLVGLTFQALWDMSRNFFVYGSVPSDVVGPLGIISIAGRSSQIGFIYLFRLLSLISLNLAVINLIPFPALDGGRLLFIIIEKIKGSPIPKKVESVVNSFGFVLLLVLMVLVTVRDIVRIF